MMNKKIIKIKLMNGIDYQTATREIFSCISDCYDFIESETPEYILFGPYGNDIPPHGEYIRIAYYCENFIPDMSICDWAFGIPYADKIKHPNYTRIEWHGFDPQQLVKNDLDVDKVITPKTKFCNFVYSHSVPFREKFFTQLSKYKLVDAPGKSMNNMSSIDANQSLGNLWERKRNFISQYKFTIAFENYSYDGYHTEKILDPMLVNSIPIYLGNPKIDKHFNSKSFINAHHYIKTNNSYPVRFLESVSQPDFQDVRPALYNSFSDRIKRKVKNIGRNLKTQLQYYDFDELIEQIIAIDQDDVLYAKYLLEPWFDNNFAPDNPMIKRWKEILG